MRILCRKSEWIGQVSVLDCARSAAVGGSSLVVMHAGLDLAQVLSRHAFLALRRIQSPPIRRGFLAPEKPFIALEPELAG